MMLREAACGRRRHGAHRDMDSAASQPLSQAAGAQRHVLQRGIVRDHRDHDSARWRRVARALDARRSHRDQRLRLRRGAIVDAQLVSGGDEVGRHRRAHRAQSDKSDFSVHRRFSLRKSFYRKSFSANPFPVDCIGDRLP